MEVSDTEDLASSTVCELGSWPSTYLGFPLGGKPISLSLWDPIVENFERKFRSWNMLLFQKG